MENECEALPGVAYPGVRDNRSTINTKTGYDDDNDISVYLLYCQTILYSVFCAFIFDKYYMLCCIFLVSLFTILIQNLLM